MRPRNSISSLEPTRYEIVASKGEERFTIGFTRGTSRASLLAAMRRRAAEILQRCQVGETDQMVFGFEKHGSSSCAYAITSGWKIGYTGRTEREASAASQSTAAPTGVKSETTDAPGESDGSR